MNLNDANLPVKERVLKRWALGWDSVLIGQKLNLRPGYVCTIVQRARARHDPRAEPRYDTPKLHVYFTLPKDSPTGDALRDEATMRKCTVEELAERLLRQVATDDLFNAILDTAA